MKNPKQDPASGGGGGVNVDGGIGCILLILWVVISVGEFVMRLKRNQQDSESPLEPPDTLVIIVTCERHRGHPRWYAWIMGITIAAICLAIAAIVATVPNEKLLHGEWLAGSLIGFIAIIALLAIFVRSPVRVGTVNRDSVILTGVSKRYFSAPDGVQP